MSANFASIQAEYDDAQDIIEAQKSEISSLTKDLKAAIDDSMAIKEKLAEAEETVAKLTSEVKALEEQQSEAKSQIETLSKQVESQVFSFKLPQWKVLLKRLFRLENWRSWRVRKTR